MNKTEIIDNFADRNYDEKILRADGLDKACVGWTDSWNGHNRNIRLVYDVGQVIKIFQERDGMSYEDAVEFYDYNVAGAYVGESTPIFVNSIEDTLEYTM